MPNRTLIIVLGVLAALALGVLVAIFKFYDGDKAIAIGALVTVVGLFIPQLLSLKQSADNGAAIDKTLKKVDDNTATTESTHRLVNGQSHVVAAAAEENALLRVERAEHKAEMIALAELTRSTLAELAARSAGIVEGRAQIVAENDTTGQAL